MGTDFCVCQYKRKSTRLSIQRSRSRRKRAAGLAYSPSLIGDVITEEEIWACTTCRNCEDQCPVMNEHVDKIIDLRRYLVLTEGKAGFGCTACDDEYRASRKSMGHKPERERKLAYLRERCSCSNGEGNQQSGRRISNIFSGLGPWVHTIAAAKKLPSHLLNY